MPSPQTGSEFHRDVAARSHDLTKTSERFRAELSALFYLYGQVSPYNANATKCVGALPIVGG